MATPRTVQEAVSLGSSTSGSGGRVRTSRGDASGPRGWEGSRSTSSAAWLRSSSHPRSVRASRSE